MLVAKWIRAGALAALVFASDARAAQDDAAIEAAVKRSDALIAQQRFDEAIELLTPHADSGRADVEYSLAYLHMSVAVDGKAPGAVSADAIRPAIEFATRAAGHGRAEGWNVLYMIHGNGWGVAPDTAKALAYLRRGADAGDHSAMLNYAIQAQNGSPLMQRDLPTACRLFARLADDPQVGATVAYYRGISLFRGDCDAPADRKGGMELVAVAARSGMRDAERDLARGYEEGWVASPDLAQAMEWYRKAADHGDPRAQWRLGMAYLNGETVARDRDRALALFRASAASDDLDGLTSLAVMHATGDGVPQDFAEARRLYQRAADLGGVHALQNLAVMAMQGEGEPRDPVKAQVLYRQSIELGDVDHPELERTIEESLDRSQRKEAERRLEAWRRQREG
ncbi:MAG TPA: tetratricopeptide repeat protein [Lysobacter sp.]